MLADRTRKHVSAGGGGGGSDVTPSNTTWWNNVFGDAFIEEFTNSVTIAGVNTTITLRLEAIFAGGDMDVKVYRNNSVVASIIGASSNNTLDFTVSNGDSVKFSFYAENTADSEWRVTNVSDGSSVLANVTVSIFYF